MGHDNIFSRRLDNILGEVEKGIFEVEIGKKYLEVEIVSGNEFHLEKKLKLC